MPSKVIKKLRKILLYALTVILALLFSLFLALGSEPFQTWLARKATDYLSDRLKTHVSIRRVKLEFFKTLVAEGIYLEDQRRDTLLYISRLEADIGELDIRRQNVFLDDLLLDTARVYLVKHTPDTVWNYRFIQDAFSRKDTSKQAEGYWNVGVGAISLSHSSFAYRNERFASDDSIMNYSDLLVTRINMRISDILIEEDTIRATVEHLTAHEKCGFVLDKFSCYVNLSPVKMQLDELVIGTPESYVATDLIFQYSEYDDFNSFEEKMHMKAAFTKNRVHSNDLAFFARELKGMEQKLEFSGAVSGRINALKGRGMEIVLGRQTVFRGDADFTGLPDIENTFMHFTIKELSTTRSELIQMPAYPFYKKEKIEVPANIGLLGQMKFKGNFSGFINDFVAYGVFSTQQGKITTDIAFRKDTLKKTVLYSGRLGSENFNAGKYFNIEKLGLVSADVRVEGRGITKDDVSAVISGKVNNIEYNTYAYKNISVEGELSKLLFKGKLDIKDENLDLEFNGDMDFSGQTTNLDFMATLNHADIAALKLVKDRGKTGLSSQVAITLSGTSLDNMVGRINFDNTIYREKDQVYRFSTFDLVSERENGHRSISLYSDFAQASLKGSYSLPEVQASLKEFLHNYYPSYFPLPEKKKKIPQQNIDFSLQIKKAEDFTRLFFPGLQIAPGSMVSGTYNSALPSLTARAQAQWINLSGMRYENFDLNIDGGQERMLVTSGLQRLSFNDSLGLSNLHVVSVSGNDSINVQIGWNNRIRQRTEGSLSLDAGFMPGKKLDIVFHPTRFYLNDSLWTISQGNRIHIDSTGISLKDFLIASTGQHIAVNGKISEQKQDAFDVDLKNINLSGLNPFLKTTGLKLEGTMDGKMTISDIYNNAVLVSNTEFNGLVVNNEMIGNGSVESIYDKKQKVVSLHGAFTRGIVPNILVEGQYYPDLEQNSLDLDLSLQAFKLQVFEPYVKEYCSDMKGQFSGALKIKGTPAAPAFSGRLDVQAKKITVNYLNTYYSFNHPVTITENAFAIKDMILTDPYGNKCEASGKVLHNNFKNIRLDFTLFPQKFLLLNTTESHNDLYYGKAFASGRAEIFGFLNNLTIEAALKTEKISEGNRIENTRVSIPLSSSAEVEESGFISFVKKDTEKAPDTYKVKMEGIQLNIDMEVTPDAQVQLIFDEKIGDVIKGRGTGNINMRINTLGNFNMYGSFMIEDGDYLFTLKNVINKRFRIENGGTISWSGDPYNADINLTTIYQARSSLKPFFPFDSSGVYKKRYPVNCILKLSGVLMSPNIAFDIELPTVDESTKQTVKSYLSTEQEMNQQVFSLLVMNSFVTPAPLRSLGVAETSGASAGAANSSELLSNQLSNWLSQISNDFDIGVNYRPGDEISDEQLEVALSTQLFNDRVSIDGNVGVSGSNENTNSMVGDVTVEYKLSDDGKIRIKAFNKANDHILETNRGPYTQGVGVFYREEFETIDELYKRYLEKIRKKKK